MPYKRNKKWLAQVKVQGQKFTKLFATKNEATRWEWEVKKEIEAGVLPFEHETNLTCLIDWANDYLEFAKAKFSKTTWEEKRTMFKHFFNSVNAELTTEDVTPGMVLKFLQKQNKERSGYAANKDRKNLVAAWNWGIKYILNFPNVNPCLVDRFPEKRQVRYVPPVEDFEAVYRIADTQQDKVMLLAYLHLAARRSELFRLRWEDVDFSESKVRLYTRKRKDGAYEFDWLPMTDELYMALLEHRQQAKTEWVFTDPEAGLPYLYRIHWMKRLCKRAGVKPFGLHGIRHLTASILANSNVPMVDIQAILRHKNLATTERYIRRIGSLRPALAVLPGLGQKKKPGLLTGLPTKKGLSTYALSP